MLRRMRALLFVSAGLVLALSFVGMQLAGKNDPDNFLFGGMTLGGALLICALFSFNSKVHGFVAGGIIGLLGAVRNGPALFEAARRLGGDASIANTALIRAVFAILCLVILLRAVGWLRAERTRQMLEEDEKKPS